MTTQANPVKPDNANLVHCAGCGAGASGPGLAIALPKLGWRLISRRWWCASCLAAARERLRVMPDSELARNK